MTAEEELIHLRHENRLLREQASLQQETISLQQELITLLERGLSMQQEQLTQFAEQVKALQERLAKDSHNSHLPPLLGSVPPSDQESAQEELEEALWARGPPRQNAAVLAVSR